MVVVAHERENRRDPMKTEEATETATQVGLILAEKQRALYVRGKSAGEDFGGVFERLLLARSETLVDALAHLVPAFKIIGGAADILAEQIGPNGAARDLNLAAGLVRRAIKTVQDVSGVDAHAFSGELPDRSEAH